MLSDEQVAAIGDGKKAFPVSVVVDGHTISLRLARMGGENLIGVARAARAEAGIELDGVYDVEISADHADRTVEIPDDLIAALADDPSAHDAFAALAPSHRKEYVRWICEAKKPETRARRVAKAVEMVRAGQKR